LILDDKFQDECGVFGIFNHEEASRLTYLGLYSLQHRGQESAGIVSSDGKEFYRARGMGQVADVFTGLTLENLKGKSAIGHVRYSTTGESIPSNVQPIVSECWRGPVTLAHNGNLVNALKLKKELERDGAIFQSTSDTEVILHLLARCPLSNRDEAIKEVLKQLRGAYSLLMLSSAALYAIRDRHGVRPLCLGQSEDGYVVASETCAFDLIGAEYIRDIKPGEILRIDKNGLTSFHMKPEVKPAHCVFEHVYFSRPDSLVFERSVNLMRRKMGIQLARETHVDADLVIPVPDSGVTAALGYAEESGTQFDFGLIRNHYVGRTFIEPKQSIRHFGVKVKLNPVKEILKGKRVVLIDDSIVRGTTSKKIVQMVRSAGASEIHFRVSSPPTVAPCMYGIDTPTSGELIASDKTIEEIRAFITADSLAYLSLEGLLDSVDGQGKFCSACFDKKYPISIKSVDEQGRLFEDNRNGRKSKASVINEIYK